MKTYIVFDLEWNQSAKGKADSLEDFPFEIIEIGAVKLNEAFEPVDEFHRLIRPKVYTQMHYAISEVTHMKMDELRARGVNFADAAADFLSWCGEDAVYCTWGSMDLTELQRNMRFFSVENTLDKPLFYYDVQKLYSLFCRIGEKISLDSAVEELSLKEERPFHRAADDAWYTGRVLTAMAARVGWEKMEPYRSVDYYRLPESPAEEIRMQFPEYSKFVSMGFPSRDEAMKERRVTEMRCYRCGRALRKKIRWFSVNQKIYYALAICPEHGYLKGKIRIKHVNDAAVFAVRTLKLTDEAGADVIRGRQEDMRKRRAERNKAKRQRLQEAKKTGAPYFTQSTTAKRKRKYPWFSKN